MRKKEKKVRVERAVIRFHIRKIRESLRRLNSDNTFIIRIESAKVDNHLYLIHGFDEVIDLRVSKGF